MITKLNILRITSNSFMLCKQSIITINIQPLDTILFSIDNSKFLIPICHFLPFLLLDFLIILDFSPDSLRQGFPWLIKIPATEPAISVETIPIIIKTVIARCLLQFPETSTHETEMHDTPKDIQTREQTTLRQNLSPIFKNILSPAQNTEKPPTMGSAINPFRVATSPGLHVKL